MSDTLTKARGMTKAESFTTHEQRIRPGPEIPPRIAEPAPQPEPSLTATANDDEQPVAVGGQRTRTYSGQARAVKNGLATLWAYDSQSGLAYELEYDELHTKLWMPRNADVMILEFRHRHVGIEGERLQALLDLLSGRRLSELSIAARPEMDPKVDGKAHIRRVAVRMPGYMRITSGKLDVLPEYDEKSEELELAEANA